ncbi:protein SSUH2 homolog isoform X3 [Stegodyphus dumicola]|uniref:protein SSUH2 homolog isoform X3 n=1 Tax=Stegodyphus dumicola TaxID=202533 RepID=UPI0015A9E159|nr:protein SSUH2 homolog isoform X3 [Stegodyphus dumicola]
MDVISPEPISRRLSYRRSITPARASGSYKRQTSCRITPPPDAVDDDGEPSAPSLELMDKVRGYESASFEAIDIPPPLLPAVQKTESEPHRSPLPNIPQLTEKEVRDALLKEVSSHCCYGKNAVRDMAVTEIKHSIAFHYTLETFTEKRTTCWAFEPYTGGTIDDKNTDQVPFPWDIPATPPSYFKNHVTQLEVPHTASIKTCHVCGGVGRKRCSTCSGSGWEYCFSCHGDGHKPSALESENGRCLQCHGTGRRRCWKCNGDGLAVCKGCCGTGQIKCFIRLTITWTDHMDDHVVEQVAALRDDRIRSVTGEVVCEEQDAVLWPLTHFPDTTVSMASAQLIQKHASCFTSEKILQQRHKVSVVPVAAVKYKWKNHEGLFHVYGYEQKVYAPDYPQTCCCCCIL